MSWWKALFGGGGNVVKGTLEGAGTFARDVRAAITGDIDPERKAEIMAQAAKLENAAMQAQMAVNQAEAGHPSLFVAGWRPFIGWTGGAAIAYQFLARPLLMGLAGLDMPEIDAAALWPVIMGMLGLGTMRTIEKANGTQNHH